MKFKEVDSCEDCPLDDEYCFAKGNPDVYHPCENKQYLDMELEDVKHAIFMRQCKAEEYEDERIAREEAKQAKKTMIKEKRRQTAFINLTENIEIKDCRTRIKKLLKAKSAYESLASLSSAMSFMTGNNTILEQKVKSPKVIEIEEKIIGYETRIAELNKIKKNKKLKI